MIKGNCKQGHLTLRKRRLKNNNKAWIKLSEAIFFLAFWEITGKSLSVPHSQQHLWKSSQPARCTYNLQPDLLGSFPADVWPNITGQLGVVIGQNSAFQWWGWGRWCDRKWVWSEIHPFTWEGGVKKVSEKCHIEGLLDIKSPQTPFIVYYPGTLSYIILYSPNSQPA